MHTTASAGGAPPCATETIIGFALKKALDKAVGGPMSIVTSYHKVHFELLSRVWRESSRDADIQKTLEAMRRNLGAMRDHDTALLKAIPRDPEPPSIDSGDFFLDPARNAEFKQQAEAFVEGVANIIEMLRHYAGLAGDLLKRTAADLTKLEKTLNMDGAKSVAVRRISNARRMEEIQFIRLDELDKLGKRVREAESLLAAYRQL